jgi:hypothetical protein
MANIDGQTWHTNRTTTQQYSGRDQQHRQYFHGMSENLANELETIEA